MQAADHEKQAEEQRRRRVAELTAGERLFLPAGIAQYLDDLRALGISTGNVISAQVPSAIWSASFACAAP